MKVNTNDNDSLFEKSFTKHPFDSLKKWCQIGLTKAFRFRYIHIISKKLLRFGILYLRGSNSV